MNGVVAAERWHVVEAASVEAAPWRNGGGVTRELLRLPAQAAHAAGEDWLLRISVADIAIDGPFSRFPGVERWFAVLSGAGVALAWSDAPGASDDVATPGSAPLCFDGERAPACRLLDGPTRDLNVMVRSDLARTRLERARWGAPWQPSAPAAGVFARVPLELRAGTGPARMLPAETLAWCEHPGPSAWTIVPAWAGSTAKAQTGPAGAAPAWWIALTPITLPAC